MNQAEQAVSNTTNQMKNKGSNMGASLKAMADMGAAAFNRIQDVVVGVGRAALMAGEDANNALSVIAAQTGRTREDLRETELAIRDLAAAQGGFTGQEMRQGLARVSRYGQTTEHQVRMLEMGLRLAQQSGNDFGSSIYALDALMVKFNADLEDAVKFTNMFATAQGVVGMGNDKLLKGLQKVAPTVNAAGLSYEFVAAAMGQAYLEGINVTNSSNGLANIFNHMLDPASDMAAVMEDIGVSAFYTNGTMRDQEVVLREVIAGLDGMSDEARGAAMAYMGLTLYGSAMLDMLSESSDEVAELTSQFAYGIAAGYDYERALHMIDQRTGGFTEAIQLARNALRNILYAINDVIGARLYEWLLEVVGELSEFINTAKESGAIDALADAVMGVVEVLMDLVRELIPIVQTWLPRILEAFKFLAPIVAENAELIAGLWIAFKGYTIISSVIGKFGLLKTAIGKLKGKQAIGGLAPAMSKALGTKGGAGLLGGAKKLLAGLGPKGWAVLGVGAGATFIADRWRRNARETEDTISRNQNQLAGTFEKGGSKFLSTADNYASQIENRYAELERNLTNYGGAAAQGLANGMTNKSGSVMNAANTVANQVTGTIASQLQVNSPSRVTMRHGEGVSQGLANGIRSRMGQVTSVVTTLSNNATNIIGGMQGRFQSAGGSAMNGLRNGLNNGVNAVMNTARSIANRVTSTIQNALRISSPSRVMKDIGENISLGLSLGIDSNADMVMNEMKEISKAIIDSLDLSENIELGIGSELNRSSLSEFSNNRNSESSEGVTNYNYNGLFEGATIVWNNAQDIRQTMQEMAWITQMEGARLV